MNLRKSIVLIKDGIKIGIIGYLTGETKFLAPKNNVEYEDEVPALQREVKKLKTQGVNILIALGHSGFIKDLEIAKYVEELDLVIGGHSNTFLSNNSTDEIPEISQGSYPTEVQQASGRIVRVVQAYAYTKYLGKLHLIFDSNGEIIQCDGTPILLNHDIPRDPELLKIVEKYSYDIDQMNNKIVGSSLVALNGDCRLRECNMGDLISDAILSYTHDVDGKHYVNIAIVQGGRIRTSIDRPEKPFNMTRGDWITVLPFTDTLTIVTMNGSILRQSLEHSVEEWRVIDSLGQFLQFSGMKVVYDLAKPPGSRVVKAQAVCTDCGSKLSEIKDSLEYNVIMCLFLAQGGDGFKIFEALPKEIVPYTEVDSVMYYLNKTGEVTQKENSRLVILNEDKIKYEQAALLRNLLPSNGNVIWSNSILQCLLITVASFVFYAY